MNVLSRGDFINRNVSQLYGEAPSARPLIARIGHKHEVKMQSELRELHSRNNKMLRMKQIEIDKYERQERLIELKNQIMRRCRFANILS
jgi:hypothetical protein